MSLETYPPSFSLTRDRYLTCQSPDAQPWSGLYNLEITSEDCLSEVRSLLNSPSKISVARNFQGPEAQSLVDFLDRVGELQAWCHGNLNHSTQALAQLRLDDKHGRRCLRLLSKICKSQKIIPASYNFQSELLRIGGVQDCGGFSQVSDGEYLGCTVAIKDLKTSEGDFDKIFKVHMPVKLRPSSFLNGDFRPALLSRGYLLETFITPKYLAFVGGFCINRAASFSHPLPVDAQRESGSVHKVQSKGKPFAAGESTPLHDSSRSPPSLAL